MPDQQQASYHTFISDLVATHVMGWKVCDHEGEKDGRWWADKDGVHICEVDDWDITSWAAAGQVVERMRERGWFWQGSMNEPSGFYSEFSKLADPKYKPASMAIGDTLPLAVCLAALNAMGVSTNDA
jgi:hypothetical protein